MKPGLGCFQVPTSPGTFLLPQPEHSSSRSEASKFADQQQNRRTEVSRFWVGQSFWNSCQVTLPGSCIASGVLINVESRPIAVMG